jgi:hypothetical protein
MKKIFLFIIVIFIVNFSIYSEEKEKKVTIQTSPFLLFTDAFASEYYDSLFAMDIETQFVINRYVNVSFIASVLLGNQSYKDYYIDDITDEYIFYDFREDIFQVNFKPVFIHRPFGRGIRGFYLGFYPNFGFSYIKTGGDYKFYGEIGYGMLLGYKFVLRSGFTIQIGAGIGKTYILPQRPERYLPANSDGRISTGSTTDIQLFDFKLGYSF